MLNTVTYYNSDVIKASTFKVKYSRPRHNTLKAKALLSRPLKGKNHTEITIVAIMHDNYFNLIPRSQCHGLAQGQVLTTTRSRPQILALRPRINITAY